MHESGMPIGEIFETFEEVDKSEIEQFIRNCNGHKENFNQTDLGLGERIATLNIDKIRFCIERNTWFVWNGKYWEADTSGLHIRSIAQQTARSIYQEAAEAKSPDQAETLAKYAIRSETTSRIDAGIKESRNQQEIPCHVDNFDNDPWLLNVENGTINLKTGELNPHNHRNMITKYIPIKYDPDAHSELWEKILLEIFGSPELVAYYQRAKGYSITADQSDQCFFFNYGQQGANGKSTVELTINGCLGNYATQVDPQAFMTTRNQKSNINEQISRLVKARLVIATELEEGQRLSTSLIKRMTGGEDLWAESKYEHGFHFKPEYKLWLSGNHEPTITDTTNSLWRRVRKIPFNNYFPPERRITNLDKILIADHAPAILTWLVNGCLEWQKQGLNEPEEVRIATANYQESQDILHDYITDNCLTVDPQANISVADLYKDYLSWCQETDIDPVGKKKFNARLEEKNYTKYRGNHNVLIWRGIRLLTVNEKNQVINDTNVTPFIQSSFVKDVLEKVTQKGVTKVDKVTLKYPESNCPICDRDEWAMFPDGSGFYCSYCKPDIDKR